MKNAKQEKIELYFYSGIPPKIELRQDISAVIGATKAITKKFSNDNGSGYKIILWTSIIPAYVGAGRLRQWYNNGEFIEGWIGALSRLIEQTKSKKFSFIHVYDNGMVKEYIPYGE